MAKNFMEDKKPIVKFQIWIGNYSLGQGYSDPTEPKLVAEVEATTFQLACQKFELISMVKTIEEFEKAGRYISHQDREWFYDWRTNSNAWTGKYYETKEEAEKSFT